MLKSFGGINDYENPISQDFFYFLIFLEKKEPWRTSSLLPITACHWAFFGALANVATRNS